MYRSITELFIRALVEVQTASLKREEGQGLTEYALILSLVAIAAIAVLITLGGDIKNAIQSVVDEL